MKKLYTMLIKRKRKHSGFTFVELLFVAALIGIISTVGLAGYRQFARNQTVEAETRKLVADLRYAQSLASSGNKAPCGSNTLNGYNFNRLSSTSYEIRASCSAGSPAATKTVTLTSSTITAPIPNPLTFLTLNDGTNAGTGNNSFTAVDITTNGAVRRARISTSGEIRILLDTNETLPGATPPPPACNNTNICAVWFFKWTDLGGCNASCSGCNTNHGLYKTCTP